ncbi:MAG: leucine-rich repeat domain-containing protein [Candidatus Poribacteria bacterium]|nr:leucine-rich repeat domain-containing protein [Candidatus Poribacteria bacterium]
MLSENKRYITSIFLALLITFCGQNFAYGVNVAERTPQVRDAIVAALPGVHNANDVTAAHLAAITSLNLSSRKIRTLKTGDFKGLTALLTLDLNTNSIRDISALEDLTALRYLYLSGNLITDISALEGLTSLRHLYLHENSISDISPLEGLTSLTRLSLHKNRIRDISALEGLTALIGLNLSHNAISDISALEDLTALTSLSLHNNSIGDISVLEGLTSLKQLDLGKNSITDISVLEGLTSPISLNLWKNAIRDVSALEGLTSLRELFLGGNAISDYGPLRRLKAAIATIASHRGFFLDITIPEVTNNAPVFTDGASTTRSVAENTASGENIGSAIGATDVDSDDTLTYTLGGRDAGSFRIVSTSGQLQTRAALDYETKSSYTVSVSDSNGGSDNIDITIDVTDAADAPVFTDGDSTTRSIAENTASGQNISTPVTATDQDNDVLTYTLSGIDAASFRIVGTTGQLQTRTALDHETDDSYSVTVTASDDNGGSTDIAVTITVTDINDAPVFTDGASTARAIAENTAAGQNIGSAVAATDVDANTTLAYTLSGTDASAFSIVRTSGQLQTNAALDFETKSSYSVTVSVSDDNNGSDSIPVTINVILTVSARSAPVRDAIVNVLGTPDVSLAQLATITTLDLSNKKIGSLHGDFSGLTGLTVLYLQNNSITDISHLSGLTQLSYLNLDNNNVNDISAVSGLIQLSYLNLDNNNVNDISAVSGLTKLTDLNLSGNNIRDLSPLNSLSNLMFLRIKGNPISVSDYNLLKKLQNDQSLSWVDINLYNNPPVFTEGSSATRTVAENTASNTNIGDAVSATDADNDTLTYTLGGTDADSFSIVSTTGQLQTSAALDFETKTSYTVTVDASDGNDGLDRITVTIDVTDEAAAAPSVETPPPPVIPVHTALLTNYPNPFNPETWIPYQLAEPAEVTLTIYDIRGVVVRELKLGHQPAGMYHTRSRAIHWDGRNGVGEKVASGLYFYTLTAGDFTATRKLLIRK